MQRMAPDWRPLDPSVVDDQLAAFDRLRRSCPVAFSEELGWSLFDHADVLSVLADDETFSSDVSQHLSVPNGMDPPEHTRFRRLLDPYFTPERVERYAATFRGLAADLVARLPDGEVEVMGALGHPFAARVQCAFMGWPDELHELLRAWTAASQHATRRRDRERLAELADEFDRVIRAQLDGRRVTGGAPDDTTTQLLAERVDGRALTDEELVSIIRNWTAGELGTIAASVGVLVRHLAQDQDLQQQLRASRAALSPAIDEILRLDGPLVANRRRTTREVELGGRKIGAGERITILWPAANRDETVFGAEVFDADAHARDNLLYGAGIHVCPGAPLARLELEILMQELLAGTSAIRPAGDPVPARYPAGGYSQVSANFAKVESPRASRWVER